MYRYNASSRRSVIDNAMNASNLKASPTFDPGFSDAQVVDTSIAANFYQLYADAIPLV
jgi:hypothetical protein